MLTVGLRQSPLRVVVCQRYRPHGRVSLPGRPLSVAVSRVRPHPSRSPGRLSRPKQNCADLLKIKRNAAWPSLFRFPVTCPVSVALTLAESKADRSNRCSATRSCAAPTGNDVNDAGVNGPSGTSGRVRVRFRLGESSWNISRCQAFWKQAATMLPIRTGSF